MIYDERIRVFLHAQDRPDPDFDDLRREAEADRIPIIRKEMESFLHVLLELKKPGSILEVGCGTGYSSLRMASYTPSHVQITTIEKDPLRAARARSIFSGSPLGERIRLIEQDAASVLPVLADASYGFLFMDAAKGQYLSFLPHALRVLEPGGVLVSDNVLQDGMILEPRTALEHRDRTIHARMREYLRVLKKREDAVTSVIPVGDGAAVTVKI